MRWIHLFPGVVLAVTAALTAAGCTSGTASHPGGAGPGAAAAPAVTDQQALQVLDSYIATSNTAARTDDAALALSDVTGMQWSQVSMFFKYSRDLHVRTSGTRAAYGTPTLFRPPPAGYPRWFAAEVSRTLAAPGGTDAAGEVVTPAVEPERVLMLFEQASATASWKLASTSLIPDGVSLPPVAAGLTPSQPPVLALSQASGLLASPDSVGPLIAAVVDDGPSSPAARVVASGPVITALYQGARAGNGLRTPRGDVYQYELEGSPYTQFAIRTGDGGALVFFTMYLNSTVEVPAELNESQPVNQGPPITIPSDLAAALPAGTTAPRVKLERQDLVSFAAVDPPAGSGGGKIAVIASGDALNYASAS